ncbi:MAG: monovalent cation/H(+) antiporter subunit G [Pseudomonadota bacterium]
MSASVAAVLILLGGAMTVFAGLGIVRMPDVFIRMHAATKVGTLGTGLIVAGVAIHFGDPSVVIRCVLIVVFLLLTAPIGAHMIGRAALRSGIVPWRAEYVKAGRSPNRHDDTVAEPNAANSD